MIFIQDIQQNYSKEIALLVLCCSVYLKTAKPSELKVFIEKNDLNWDTVYALAKMHRIRSVVYETLVNVDDLNIHFKDQLKKFYLKHSLYAFRCQQKAEELISTLKKHEIPIQLYKGVHFSQLIYNHLSVREFGDIDFIVKKEHIPRLVTILKQSGYTMEGEELFTDSVDDYLSHQKDVICFDKTPEGIFLYEFHYKPIGSYLAMNISFEDLLPSHWKIGEAFSASDYLPLITVNHGLVDLYPNLRCMLDIALLLQQSPAAHHYKQKQKLSGYYALNAYLVKNLFNIEYTEIFVHPNPHLIASIGKKIIDRLLKKKEIGRVPTSTIIKVSFLLREGIVEKLKLVKAVIKYIITPNYNDTSKAHLKYKWMYTLTRPFRLIQNLKRYI